MMSAETASQTSFQCSFCRKGEADVGRLISNPSDYPRAYICDECISVCAAILEDDRPKVDFPFSGEKITPHPLLTHPEASELMARIQTWIREESLGKDGLSALDEVRSTATRMMSEEPWSW